MNLQQALSSWPWLAGGALLLLLCARAGQLAWRRALRRRRMLRAQRGERDAEQLLRALGYRVLGRQVRKQLLIEVDGAPVPVSLRADYLVQRGRKRLVAEVKTGDHAPQLHMAGTRRQLLEYHLAYGADAALLVDMEAGRVQRVRFPTPRGRLALRAALAWLLAGAALGALAVWRLSSP